MKKQLLSMVSILVIVFILLIPSSLFCATQLGANLVNLKNLLTKLHTILPREGGSKVVIPPPPMEPRVRANQRKILKDAMDKRLKGESDSKGVIPTPPPPPPMPPVVTVVNQGQILKDAINERLKKKEGDSKGVIPIPPPPPPMPPVVKVNQGQILKDVIDEGSKKKEGDSKGVILTPPPPPPPMPPVVKVNQGQILKDVIDERLKKKEGDSQGVILTPPPPPPVTKQEHDLHDLIGQKLKKRRESLKEEESEQEEIEDEFTELEDIPENRDKPISIEQKVNPSGGLIKSKESDALLEKARQKEEAHEGHDQDVQGSDLEWDL